MEVGSQWTGKLFGKEPAESSPVDATNDLTDEMAVVDRVIARRRTRGPPRLLGSEASGGRLEVVDVRQFDRALPTGDARRMRQEVANFDVFLTVCRKFGPVVSNFLAHVQLAAFDQQERTQGRHGLGDGERVDDGVAAPWSGTGFVGVPAPEIDHGFSVDGDGNGAAEFFTGFELSLEGGADGVELVVAVTVHQTHARSAFSSSCAAARAATGSLFPEAAARLVPLAISLFMLRT